VLDAIEQNMIKHDVIFLCGIGACRAKANTLKELVVHMIKVHYNRKHDWQRAWLSKMLFR
jgi:hypothetical protein